MNNDNLDSKNVKYKTKIGIVWNFIEKTSVQIVSFVISIVLARQLTPYDYGVVGMFNVFLSYSNVLVESGFTRGLIQKKDANDIDYSSTFYVNLIMSCFIYIILFFCAPLIANLYNIPEYLTLERILFINIILNSLVIVQNARLQKKIDFKTIAVINFFSILVSGLIGIYAAYSGLGVWAIVVQSLSRGVLSTILYWGLGKWYPKLVFSISSFKNLFSYSSKLLFASIVGNTVDNIGSIIVGKIYNPTIMGYYTRARQFPELTSGTVSSVLNNVTFPLMASIRDNKNDLRHTFGKLISITAMINIPAMVGLGILSKEIIIVLLGEKWLAVYPLLFWIAFSYILRPINSLNMNLLNAIGRSDLFLKVYLSKIPVQIIVMIFTYPISIDAVVIGETASAIIYFVMSAYLIGRLYNFGPIKQLCSIWKYIISSIVMSVFVIIISNLITSDLLILVVGIFTGIIIYALMLILLKDNEFLLMLKKILKPNK
ncbi:MAG: lipopolysaccharide biosynthesis protein [Spirochaetaceae bacterium]|nr:lipopolysaccharide biosynthesis protein [Spirochaetaceae bacterium]